MTEYLKSDYYEDIASEVIKAKEKLHFITEMGLKVAYRTSNQPKKKGENLVFADCEKVTEKNKMYMDYDFIVTVYEPNVADWDSNRIKVLMWHELSHIGAEYSDDGVKTWCVPHDFEDFFDIYNAFGIGWELKTDLPDICKATEE